MTNQQFQKCIDACIECAVTCNHCAVSCLEEKEVQHLVKCIRLDLECAIICRTAAELMSLDSRYSKEICNICAAICNDCAEICEQHANMGMEHCRECAEACRACAKETMELYQNLKKQDKETNGTTQQFVQQDECAVICRAAAELISLDSAYINQISQLNATICNASAEEFEKHMSMGMKHINESAKTAIEAHRDLTTQDLKTNDASQNETEKNTELVLQAGMHKKKKKHSSALLAASMGRSALAHAGAHSYKDGNYTYIGTNGSYRSDQEGSNKISF